MIPAKKLFSLALAGACLLVANSGCKKTTTNVPAATAATPAAPPVALQLSTGKPISDNVDVMPRIINPSSPGQVQVNAMLDAIDKDSASQLRQNKTFSRTVNLTMAGPGYLSFFVSDSWNGGAYPASLFSVVIFDLNTGQVVDWTKLVNSPGLQNYSDTGADGKLGMPQALIDPALMAMYLKVPDNAGECQTAYHDEQPFLVWPEAKSGGLVVEAFDLPHVVQACENPMPLTQDQAKALGFNADFLKAVAAAHMLPGADKLAAPGD